MILYKYTVKFAYKEAAYKELIFVPQSLEGTISLYILRNSNYKEQIFMVPVSSL